MTWSDACVFAFHEGCDLCGCPCHDMLDDGLEADANKVVEEVTKTSRNH